MIWLIQIKKSKVYRPNQESLVSCITGKTSMKSSGYISWLIIVLTIIHCKIERLCGPSNITKVLKTTTSTITTTLTSVFTFQSILTFLFSLFNLFWTLNSQIKKVMLSDGGIMEDKGEARPSSSGSWVWDHWWNWRVKVWLGVKKTWRWVTASRWDL